MIENNLKNNFMKFFENMNIKETYYELNKKENENKSNRFKKPLVKRIKERNNELRNILFNLNNDKVFPH